MILYQYNKVLSYWNTIVSFHVRCLKELHCSKRDFLYNWCVPTVLETGEACARREAGEDGSHPLWSSSLVWSVLLPSFRRFPVRFMCIQQAFEEWDLVHLALPHFFCSGSHMKLSSDHMQVIKKKFFWTGIYELLYREENLKNLEWFCRKWSHTGYFLKAKIYLQRRGERFYNADQRFEGSESQQYS